MIITQTLGRSERMRPSESSIGPTVDRLCAEFGDRVTRDHVSHVIDGCVRDLAGTPPGAMPELCERLARQRLLDTSNPRWAKASRN